MTKPKSEMTPQELEKLEAFNQKRREKRASAKAETQAQTTMTTTELLTGTGSTEETRTEKLSVVDVSTKAEKLKLPPSDEKKRKTASTQAVPLNSEVVRTLTRMLFDFAATARGEFWRLTDAELQLLSESLKPVLEKYAPKIVKKAPEEAVLLMTAIVVLFPRVQQEVKNARNKREAKKNAQGNSRSAGSTDGGSGDGGKTDTPPALGSP